MDRRHDDFIMNEICHLIGKRWIVKIDCLVVAGREIVKYKRTLSLNDEKKYIVEKKKEKTI